MGGGEVGAGLATARSAGVEASAAAFAWGGSTRAPAVREGRGSQGDVWRNKHEAQYLRRLHAEPKKMPEGRREQHELSFELVQPLLWPVASEQAQASSSV